MDSDRVVGTAKQVGGKLEGTAGDVIGDAKTQAQGRVDAAAGAAQAAYGQAKDAVRDYADQAYGVAERALDQGRRYVGENMERYPEAGRYVREGRQAVSRQVEESPLLAVLIAGAVGYMLALLVHARR